MFYKYYPKIFSGYQVDFLPKLEVVYSSFDSLFRFSRDNRGIFCFFDIDFAIASGAGFLPSKEGIEEFAHDNITKVEKIYEDIDKSHQKGDNYYIRPTRFTLNDLIQKLQEDQERYGDYSVVYVLGEDSLPPQEEHNEYYIRLDGEDVRDGRDWIGYVEGMMQLELDIYTDGGYKQSVNPNVAGWAFYIEGLSYSEFGIVPNPKSRQIDGEIQAILNALDYCSKNLYNSKDEITIIFHHDYVGLAKWVSREWKAKSEVAIDYVNKFDAYVQKGWNVKFNWVRGHQGNEGNEIADTLSSNAILESVEG